LLCSNDNAISKHHLCTIGDGLKAMDNFENGEDIKSLMINLRNKCDVNKTIPCEKKPIKNEIEIAHICILNQIYINLNNLNLEIETGPHNIKEFPGDYHTKPQLIQQTEQIKLKTKFDNERLSTGFYLPAGVICNVE
jgi:hypothetical protein